MIRNGILAAFITMLVAIDGLAQVIDTGLILSAIDTLQLPDSTRFDTIPNQVHYPISNDAIDQKVDYGALDSQFVDAKLSMVHLYGGAYVRYGELELQAGYIRLDLNSNIAVAEGWPDSLGTIAELPIFNDGSQEIKASSLRYNFKKKRGLIYDSRTKEAGLHIQGVKAKFYAEEGEEGNHIIYNQDAIFTTCDHEIPHFGIRSKKQKIVAGKVAIIGPSNLEIGGVPTPLYLPFGFFPLKKGKRSGLMFPNNYQFSERWGYGFQNVGYYFPISDKLDITLLTDLYFRGSYSLNGEIRYKKRYKYNGSVNLGLSSFKQEEVFTEIGVSSLIKTKQNSYFLRLSHSQEAGAHPYRTIGGSINIESNRYDNLNYNSADRVLNNTLSSNFSMTQKFPGTPFTATLGLTHSQNTASRQIRMSLPRLDIRMKQVNPFKKKKRVGPENWYEIVSLGYSSSLRYDLQGIDSTFFEAETFQNAKFGIQHNITTSVNFNVLKYFQLSPFLNVTETWYSKETNRSFDQILEIEFDTLYNDDSSDSIITIDTIGYGETNVNRLSSFNAIHEYDAGISLFTKLYGTVRFKKGAIRGIRHTLKPTMSLSYSPDYTRNSLGYFDDYQISDDNGNADTLTYSIFEQENFGSPSSSGERLSLNYSLTNLFEAKLFSKKDSTSRKAKILDNLNIGGNYNFVADSLNWSQITFSGNVRLLKGIATLKMSGAFDPYAINENGIRINKFERKVSGNILRFDNARFSLNAGMTLSQLADLFQGKKSDKSKLRGKKKQSNKNGNLFSLFEKLRVTYQFTLRSRRRGDNSIMFAPSTHSISIRGDIPLSPKWNLSIGNIDYNFLEKATSYPDLSLSRDLHCWNLGLSWQPSRGTYSFYIRVKPGPLDFIQAPYRRNRVDGFNF